MLLHLSLAHLFYQVPFSLGREKVEQKGSEGHCSKVATPVPSAPTLMSSTQIPLGLLLWVPEASPGEGAGWAQRWQASRAYAQHIPSLGLGTKCQTDVSTKGNQKKVLIKAREISMTLASKEFLYIFVQEDSLTQFFFNSTVVQITSLKLRFRKEKNP